MRQQLFKGTGVATITPFQSDGEIDYAALERILEYQIEGGVDYIVSLGTTGEAVTLSSKECREVFDFTIKTVNGRVPIVAGLFGRNDTKALVDRLKEFNFDGFAGILSSSPAYTKPSQEGIFQHYMHVEKASPLPIIIYNVPGRTASNISAETIVRLAKASEKFVAVKEASGDIVQGMSIIKHAPEDFLVLSGDDPTAMGLIAGGGHGVISVIANSHPHVFSNMINAALKGDFATAQKLNIELHDIHQWLYCEGNPVGIKGAMEVLGLSGRHVRLPLTPLSEDNLLKLKTEMMKTENSLKKSLVEMI